MKYFAKAFVRLWWLAAIIAVSSCAPQKNLHLYGLSDDSTSGNQVDGGSTLREPGGFGRDGGTSGGNPRRKSEETSASDPTGAVSQILMCIDLASLQLNDPFGNVVIPLGKDGTNITPAVSLVERNIQFHIDGIFLTKVRGATFNLFPDCRLGGKSITFTNQQGTFESTDVLTVRLSGSAVGGFTSLDVTLDAGALIDGLAGVTDASQIPGVIADLP